MSVVILEISYSNPCPVLATDNDSRLLALSGSPECDSFTTSDGRKHSFSFNYDSDMVGKVAMDRIRGVARRIIRDNEEVAGFDIRFHEGVKADISEF